MKDDYLWDGSGEPDPEIEQIEQMLGRYRHKGKAPELPVRRSFSPRLAVAAAILLMALAGLAFFLMSRNDTAPPNEVVAIDNEPQKTKETPGPVKQPGPKHEEQQSGSDIASGSIHRPAIERGGDKSKRQERIEVEDSSQGAITYAGFFDAETSRHIERAQMLLRSFRNVRSSEGDDSFDLSYEKRRSRELLDKNVALRRGAEMKGNLPVEELLVSLEPYLLDIANLPDSPAPEDVRAIKDRLEKREVVATLQVYSASALVVNN